MTSTSARRYGGVLAALSRHRHVGSLFGYTALIFGIYFPVVVGSASLKTDGAWPSGPLMVADPEAGGPITMPLERLATLSWSHLQLPIVDPYQGFGISLLGNQANAVFPPEVLFHLLWSSNPSLWNVVRLVVLAYGSYLLCSSLGIGTAPSLAAGVAAALVGVAPPNLNLGMLNPLAVFPFVLLSIRYAFDPDYPRRNLAFLGTATSVALLALSGFPEVLPVMGVVIAIFSVAALIHFRTFGRAARRLVGSVIAMVAGGVIGLVGLLPTLTIARQGGSINGPTSYDSFVPHPWFITTLVPSVVRGAMAGSPADIGQSMWLLGTPVLLFVILVAAVIAVRDQSVRWYVVPCIVLSAYGLAGYFDLFGVLRILRFFPFDDILMIRFLQFGWWIPWVILLGVVIASARIAPWFTVVPIAVASVGTDVLAARAYERAILDAHLPSVATTTHQALLIAGAITLVFMGSMLIRQRPVRESVLLMVTLASCLYYLPTNFFPATGNIVVDRSPSPIPGTHEDPSLMFEINVLQLPTLAPNIQIFGPLIPSAYAQVLSALVAPAMTTNDSTPLYFAGPTLYFAKVTPTFVSILAELGVNEVVSPTPLASATFGSPPPCTHQSGRMCVLSSATSRKQLTTPVPTVYLIRGVNAMTVPISRLRNARSNAAGLAALVRLIRSHPADLDAVAYASLGRMPRVAHGLSGVSSRLSTEQASVSLRAEGGGLVALRRTYTPGMTATVNGHNTNVVELDGGLWTGVVVKSGISHIRLNYVTASDVFLFVIAGAGLLVLLMLWCALGGVYAMRRIRR